MKTKQVSVRLPLELWQRLSIHKTMGNVKSAQAGINIALERFVDELDKKHGRPLFDGLAEMEEK
ncbi:hypothetical protein Dalk_4578 [Desulfatibacillum aliphaticivorans]|uniref:CopG domain protein DNA-binding domain protein n=1 Tax=Desulfatibacillum aliphaticivorans TaxID=218208 RepID=B8FNH5_DESAL|nr:hypothetical protein [Desulfatibacillum aliphaticivorans]ACL06256.1 hypothetical protein Dalk_4578 [Desulfatibacillum aliphaticivorans]